MTRKEIDMRDKKAFDTEDFDRTAAVTPVKVRWHNAETPAEIVPDLIANLEQSLGLPEESIKHVLARPEKKFSEAEIQRSIAIVQEIQLAEVGTEAKTQMLESGSFFEPAEERRKQLADIAKQ